MLLRVSLLAGLLVLLTGIPSHAEVPDLRQWQKVTAKGSRVTDIGRGKARFVISRRSRGSPDDPLTHGYAYLLSGPVELPDNWRRVEISGEWWRMPFKRNCHPELALRIHARYPRFPHGNVVHGESDSNFIHVGYASWNQKVHYSDMGDGSAPMLTGVLPASFPEQPRGFMLTISREINGIVSWSFYQRDGRGVWRRVFHIGQSGLFDGVTGPPRIFIKIGGWNTWKEPVSNRLQVRNLRIDISSWGEGGGGPPDNGQQWNEGNYGEGTSGGREGLQQEGQGEFAEGGGESYPPEDGGAMGGERMQRLDHCPDAPFVANVTQGMRYDSLQEALGAAAEGDRLELGCGVYHGHFVIDKRLELTSADGQRSAVLDGDGQGVVLRIKGAGVVVSMLDVRGSGVLEDANAFWQESGILVEADNVRLHSLNVHDNGNGIAVVKASGARIESSRIENNHLAGVTLAGASHTLISNTRVEGNEEGIALIHHYPRARRLTALMLIPQSAGKRHYQAFKEMQAIMEAKTPSAHNRVVNSTIKGNGAFGILVSGAHHTRIENNRIMKTGLLRRPLSDGPDVTVVLERLKKEPYWDDDERRMMKEEINKYDGSAIYLNGLAHHNEVRFNKIDDNLGHGIVLDLAEDNLVQDNMVTRNRCGILLTSGSKRQKVTGNRVNGNREMGVSIGDYQRLWLTQWPTENLIARNDISGNGRGDVIADVNDASSTQVDEKTMWELIADNPWISGGGADAVRQSRDPATVVRNFIDYMKPGHNRWDDGALGNHYGVFDSRDEGFVDENGDGISEQPFSIPGGTAVDNHPLSEQLINRHLPPAGTIAPQ